MDNKNNELTHWGIKGMAWGKRRYQNKDGSLTPAGVKRYLNKGIEERQKSGDTRDFMNTKSSKSSGSSSKSSSSGDSGFNNMTTVPGKKSLFKDKSKKTESKTTDNRDFMNTSSSKSTKSGDEGFNNMTTVPGKKALYKEKKQKAAEQVNDFIKKSDAKKSEDAESTKSKKVEETKKNDTKPDSKDEGNSGGKGGNDSGSNGGGKGGKKKKSDTPDNNESTKTESIKDTGKKEISAKQLQTASNVARVAGKAIKEEGVAIAKAVNRNKNAKEMEDYTKMSNAELKAKIDRIRLENDYVNVSMAKTTAAQQKVEGFLTIAGNVIAIAGTGLSIAAMVKKMKD